jgi:hypothetical protein
MWIIADINGWRKYIKVPIDTQWKGFCYIVLEPPLDTLVKPKDIVNDDFGAIKVMLRHVGYDEKGIEIYKYNL